MKRKENVVKEKKRAKPQVNKRKKDLPGYPLYPKKEDIYNKEKKLDEIDPDDNSKVVPPAKDPDAKNEKDFDDEFTGEDLDVPGSELDDAMEDIGEEDEENNYYSLGGDNHDD